MTVLVAQSCGAGVNQVAHRAIVAVTDLLLFISADVKRQHWRNRLHAVLLLFYFDVNSNA